MTVLTAHQVDELDPYAFMAVLGKRVIHPGGREATAQLLEWADVRSEHQLLDVGCGVATTAIEIARDHGASVTAADISPLMIDRAEHNVRAADLGELVEVEHADVTALPYPDDSFDRVLAEAVTMFVDRPRAVAELVRVCRPGGRVLATEFFWRHPPTEEARQIFLGEVCPGLRFEGVEEWVEIYAGAGLADLRTATGPFEMMTARGFLADERALGSARFLGRALTRTAYLRKLAWLMPRMARAVPYLGYLVVAGDKPA